MDVDGLRSFVIADIPGLIEGAAEGAGLGIQFLKHLSRTRILLHVIDIAPFDESDPVESANTILNELKKFSPEMLEEPRWLVLNKVDLMPREDAEVRCREIIEGLNWTGPYYEVAAISGEGTKELVFDIMNYLEENDESAKRSI